MPRAARSSVSQSNPKAKKAVNKSKKRSLQAFSIASLQNPETHKIRKHRLGAVEDDGPRRKRQRSGSENSEGSEDESGPSSKRPQKKVAKGIFDELDVSEGSDSEGNRWKLGVVDDGDDSDIDSEDAFGSSDEERFAGFTFRGSSSSKGGGKVKRSKKKRVVDEDGDHDLDLEEEEDEGNSDGDDDSLGEDAVDLATMLDNYSGSEDDDDSGEGRRSAKGNAKDLVTGGASDDSSSEAGDDEEDARFESSSEIGEQDDEDQLAQLQEFVAGLQPSGESAGKKLRREDPHEARAPSTSGLVSSEKFDINDFLMSASDPQIKKMSKQLGSLPKTPKKDPKLAASLPKRQKDKLDRVAANEKAKETLNRWVDTVKHNRRAEHLTFPLQDPEAVKPHGSKQLLPTNQSAPMNDLESAIHNILQESGLVTGKTDEEEAIREFEELKMNKMPLEEVQARRAELRKARDLLFREEIRSKRVKKIKSKSYRRVHRKEREKLSAMDRDAFAEGGENDMAEEDQNQADRRRAEERMGAKHRDSKWAKQMKKSGRSVWDEDARSGVSEMAQRNEELRRRIEGKDVRNEDGSDEEPLLSSEEEGDGDDSNLDDDAAEFQSLQRQLNRLNAPRDVEESGPGARLNSLKFMQQADAARKARNDEDIARMKKELAGEDGSDQSEKEETLGRKIFGPNRKLQMPLPQQQRLNEFEEPLGSEDEQDRPKTPSTADETALLIRSAKSSSKPTASTKPAPAKPNGISKKQEPISPSKSTNHGLKPELLPGEKHSQPDTEGWITVSYDNESEAEDKAGSDNGSLLDQAEILRRAFAGDNVEEAFSEEKAAIIADEDDKIIDDTLPGWGSWVGSGLTKREQKRNTGRLLRKEEGIKPEERKDAKLKHVIVNQKRVKKNVSYMANALPFPFTSRAEYERSIRMPVGSEWNVKSIYQNMTKPRVIVKPGSIIKPMRKPLV